MALVEVLVLKRTTVVVVTVVVVLRPLNLAYSIQADYLLIGDEDSRRP
jgi:hypothetical protein